MAVVSSRPWLRFRHTQFATCSNRLQLGVDKKLAAWSAYGQRCRFQMLSLQICFRNCLASVTNCANTVPRRGPSRLLAI